MAFFSASGHRIVDADTSDHTLVETLVSSVYSALTDSTRELHEHVMRPNDRVRYLACWAPEKNTARGKEAIEYVRRWFFTTHSGHEINVEGTGQRDAFGRLLGLIHCSTCKETLNEVLVRDGFATVKKSALHRLVLTNLNRRKAGELPAVRFLAREMANQPGEWEEDAA